MLDFVKLMYSWGCPIEGYVANGAITADEYKQITDEPYKQATGSELPANK